MTIEQDIADAEELISFLLSRLEIIGEEYGVDSDIYVNMLHDIYDIMQDLDKGSQTGG